MNVSANLSINILVQQVLSRFIFHLSFPCGLLFSIYLYQILAGSGPWQI